MKGEKCGLNAKDLLLEFPGILKDGFRVIWEKRAERRH